MSNPLKEITYKTLKNLRKQDIVLPLEYSKAFRSVASQLGVDIEDKEAF